MWCLEPPTSVPPWSSSRPASPYSVSLPPAPSMRSLPPLPCIVSLPPLPLRESEPPWPSMKSFPPLPEIVSRPSVPARTFTEIEALLFSGAGSGVVELTTAVFGIVAGSASSVAGFARP